MKRPALAFTIFSLALTACGGGGGAGAATAVPVAVATASATASASYTCPTAQTSGGTLNCAALPLGDLKYSTSGAQRGSIYLCHVPGNSSPAVSSAPWLDTSAHTWNALQKVVVQGAVSWAGSFHESVNGTNRAIASNGLPTVASTGTFPIQSSDPASQYDRNPNSIAAQTFDFSVPANPSAASSPGCLDGGPIGITVTGVAVYDAFDGAGYDGVAREEQDACHGHPDQSSTYHYHGWLQACVPDGGSPSQNSSLLGYAADGYGIYGPWYGGKMLTSSDLDACHGTTSPVMWDGQLVTMYHYVSTYDFPYTLGCYHGIATRI